MTTETTSAVVEVPVATSDHGVPTLGQRVVRGAATVVGMAVAVTTLVALAVPSVRATVVATVWPLVALAGLGVVAVVLVRRHRNFDAARRVVHEQHQSSQAKSARAQRAARRAANRARNAQDRAERAEAARAERERQRQENRARWRADHDRDVR